MRVDVRDTKNANIKKHLIVLSDGLTDGEKNFDRLAQGIAADGITIGSDVLMACVSLSSCDEPPILASLTPLLLKRSLPARSTR